MICGGFAAGGKDSCQVMQQPWRIRCRRKGLLPGNAKTYSQGGFAAGGKDSCQAM
jgi:hypothetical protein